MSVRIKATLATLVAMLMVGMLFKILGLFENFRTVSFYTAAALLGFLGAHVWIFVTKNG